MPSAPRRVCCRIVVAASWYEASKRGRCSRAVVASEPNKDAGSKLFCWARARPGRKAVREAGVRCEASQAELCPAQVGEMRAGDDVRRAFLGH